MKSETSVEIQDFIEKAEEKSPKKLNMSLPVSLNFASPVVREWIQKRREEVRPWTTFVKTSNFNFELQSPPKFTKRFYKNIDHFQSNYVFVFLILFLYCLITSPMLLIFMAISGGLCYYLSSKNTDRKIILGGREVSLAQQYGVVAVCSVPMFLFAGAGAVVFWVIGASFFVICLHASFYNFDALDITEDQQALTGSIVEEV